MSARSWLRGTLHVSYLQTYVLIINLISTLGVYQPLTAIVQMNYKCVATGLLLAVQRRSGGGVIDDHLISTSIVGGSKLVNVLSKAWL